MPRINKEQGENGEGEEEAVMEKSGQTDEERRKLRQAQRSLQKYIIDNGEAIEDPIDETFRNVRGKNNELFNKVFYTRESVLDGENLDLISTHATRQTDSLVQVPRYDALRFIQKLRRKCTAKRGSSSAYFDWATLGKETGTCFNALPARVQFLAGPLQADFAPKERKPRAKRQKVEQESDHEKEEHPEEVKNQETNADQLSAVERNIVIVHKTLHNCSKAAFKTAVAAAKELPEEKQAAAKQKTNATAGEVCAIQYMMNPRSFTQSVENMFHYSFLVQKGKAKFTVRDGTPKVAMIPDSKDGEQHPPAKQSVVSFTMRDWRRLCKAYKVSKSDIPHRTGSKQKRAAKRAAPEEDEE